MSKSQILNLGGFDERLIMTEDTDLAFRAREAGEDIVYLPEAVGYHNHSKSLHQLCAQTEASAWWTAQLMKKHPEMRGQLPIYREIEPIALGEDPYRLVLRKFSRGLQALSPLRVLLAALIRLLEVLPVPPRILRFFYWRLLGNYRFVGFRRGSESHLFSETF